MFVIETTIKNKKRKDCGIVQQQEGKKWYFFKQIFCSLLHER